jgi:hypothetical protein
MPKTYGESRSRRYRERLNPERIKEDLEHKKDQMIAEQARTAARLAEIENLVRGVLGDEEVISIDYVKYYNFAREVYKCQERLSGGYALRQEVQILVDKWVARNAVKRILEKIRNEVFSISGP